MQPIPYCGTPPVPGSVSWNLDPILLGALAASALVLGAWTWRHDASAGRRAAFLAGYIVLALCLISPWCNLSVALFSVRISQHMLIEFVAAPLLALGLPRKPGRGGRLEAGIACATFAVLLWFWHLPVPYEWTFRSTGAYWLMHASLAASAVMLWRLLLDKSGPARSLAASSITALQMTVLGAVYSFAGEAFFKVHFGTTWVWGLSPLEDQQLGGLIMWIPPGLLLAAVAAYATAQLLAEPDPAPLPRAS